MKNKTLDNLSTLVLLGGVSGAGTSTALNVISDLGFTTTGNLPVSLLPDFLKLAQSKDSRFVRTAVLLDIDSQANLEELLRLIKGISPNEFRVVLMFLDCNSATIVKRYSETRRPHPGFDPSRDKTLEDTILREKGRLLPFREIANLVLDTSDLSVHDLKREVRTFVETVSPANAKIMRINFLSFGFKYGIPLDCDLVVDVRFLPNPHFIEALRPKTGLDAPVADFVLQSPEAQTFLLRYAELLNFLLPRYAHEGKAYLNIGVGCTGGKHRSIAIAEKLSAMVGGGSSDYLLSVKHRDVGRE